MKRKIVWYAIIVLILGLALLFVSCAAPTPPPAEEQPPTQGMPAEDSGVKETEVKEAPSGAPPAIPHTLEGRADCLMCHKEGGLKPYPADHAGRGNEVCTTCHKAG